MLAHNDVTAMIAVKELGRARKFYEEVLRLPPVAPEFPEVQVYLSGNTRIAVYVSEFAGTNRATSITWEVGDVEGVVTDLKSRGVRFEHYPMPNTTLQGDIHVSGLVKNAWFKDPDGNILGIMNKVDVVLRRQTDRTADAKSGR